MNVSIQLSDEARGDVREAIAGPLIAYNTQKAGFHDSQPLVLTISHEGGDVVGGL